MLIGFIVLFVSAIAAGFTGGYWRRLWIWAAIVRLVVITGLITPVAAGHYNKIRSAIGQKLPRDKTDAPPPEPRPPDQLAALLMAPTPWILVAVGGIGFAVILLLIMFKPFRQS